MTEKTKMKVVEEKIKEILQKYDMAASVTLHRPGISLSFVRLNTTYSCVYQINDEDFVIKCTSDDFPDEDIRKQKIINTGNMLKMIYKNEERTSKFLEIMSQDLDSKGNLFHNDINQN